MNKDSIIDINIDAHNSINKLKELKKYASQLQSQLAQIKETINHL